MSSGKTKPTSYLDRLLAELDDIQASYAEVLKASAIINIDPNRRSGAGATFIGFAKWGWAKSDATLEASRMELLRRLREWEPRFRLLFPHPTPVVSKRLDEGIGRLERWLVRKPRERGVPSTVDQASELVNAAVADLRDLAELLPEDQYAHRLTVDTNTLLDDPDLAAYVGALGKKYMVHLLPVVLGEIDELKRAGRNDQVRDAAKRADRRLKGLRDNGDVRAGVRVG